ncbi:myotubularin-related protein 3-like [Chanos chanos]|uniref:phosphatidylinositol-3,5-bisphosphate 3-phosphatase n=1 Tax=Chanos chanos TaxID=29144 RepID=A0A6J2VGU6_CHACN|nr:myotubularin-related protein 3-like [Chanos chanos]
MTSQSSPLKSPVLEEEHLQVPFSPLHGERVEYAGRMEGAVIAMSSYRLHIKFKESIVNVPLQLVESVECRDLTQLHVVCKDCKVIRCQFGSAEQCQDWLRRLTAVVRPPSRLEELFSFAFHTEEREGHGEMCRAGEHVRWRFQREVERMAFHTHDAWRVTDINRNFRLCASYPEQLLVPAWVTDKELENVAAFRSWKRFPAVVYRHQRTGAVIGRCGQPEVSWWGWRNADDERLVQSIAKACTMDTKADKTLANGFCSQHHTNSTQPNSDPVLANGNVGAEPVETPPQKLLILDARSYAAAVANRAKGGGCECPEYYPNCEVVFMSMANIHSIRKSFQSLRALCAQVPDPTNWLSALEGTKWLQHLSLLLKAALLVVNATDQDGRPVLVHCSDGWDRTPQIVALSKLLLDPFYRTTEGFQVLVETEWLDFGHKFADRCGHGENADDANERCPVFLQWLDCVHQLQRQFPCSFQFNEAFLVKLVQHTYSCLFGTFLCNSAKEREEHRVQENTCSVWSLLHPSNRAFQNILYSPHSETVLHPVCHVRNLMLWSAVYLPNSAPSTPSDDACPPYPDPATTPEDSYLGRLVKTRSYENLPVTCEGGCHVTSNRRCSDPSLNDKWQEHLRSVDIAAATEPEDSEADSSANPSTGCSDGEVGLEERLQRAGLDDQAECNGHYDVNLGNGEMVGNGIEEAGLSVAVGVADGQIEDILQEAREEGAVTEERRRSLTLSGTRSASHSLTTPPPPEASAEVPAATCEEPINTMLCEELHKQTPELSKEADSEPAPAPPTLDLGHVTNGHIESVQGGGGDADKVPSPVPCQEDTPPPNPLSPGRSNRTALTETPTDTPDDRSPTPATVPHDSTPSPQPPRTLNGLRSPSSCALQPLFPPDAHVCNGDATANANGVRTPLSRQVSVASCGSLSSPHVHSWDPSGRGPSATPHSHLGTDGLSLHSDAVQLRLQQIEAGHQLQVETLKRQVQELWSRLQVNGELSSVSDCENNLNPACLSRCSTELLSDSCWEQLELRDGEATRWYPDHLATRCYGCEHKFWLAARKQHCRNCGNVFCASCCNQKVALPSQQMYEPNRVCQACYGHLCPSAVPPAVPPADLELEKPITASSN